MLACLLPTWGFIYYGLLPSGPLAGMIAPPDTTRQQKPQTIIPEVEIEDETIPDSLLHPRWPVQRTTPVTYDDLDQGTLDLNRPENMQQTVEYNDSLDRYIIGNKIGGTYVSAPVMMTPEEYRKWSEKRSFADYYRSKNQEILQQQGKEKFDFTNMHFNLGPAEKIFGPGGVRIKTQGTAELKFGATVKKIDNPSLPIRNRNTTIMDFDEKINLNVNGKVGDKVNMNLNYNTDATFDYDAQNFKLKYEGKEDEIIKLVEGGNVSFPSNNSLVQGASSLFGIRTDMQFGKLKLQTVVSQKKSSNKSVSSKGGKQLTPFEINASDYEENRHFFLSQYFRDQYSSSMRSLPNLTTGVTINRVEIWVTNKTGTTDNTRDIVAFTDLGENEKISRPALWGQGTGPVPSNNANTEYSRLVGEMALARDVNQVATTLEAYGLEGGVDYEKLSKARLLSPSEYTVNNALGYVSLRSGLQTDQVLAVAYEYTYGGQTYQVGEFASDRTDANSTLFVKSLKNTSNNPHQGNWDLMMKNVYYLASTIEKEKFRLDVKYQSDTTGVYISYIPELQVKNQTIIKLLGADRLDNNNRINSNGYFDFVEGYTVSNGRVFFPEPEPFGEDLKNLLVSAGLSADQAGKYAYTELYDSTKTVAKQIAEKDKFNLVGQYRGTSANVISLGAYNVPQGSVVVTAGGVTLTEGSDYSVDYSAGEVTILNQSIIDAGTSVNVSLESQEAYSQERKTMLGVNWEYDFSKNFQLGGTFMHLSEQALTTKVNMGSEPLNNTIWGLNLSWKKESQWLTNVLDKIPFLHLTQPSHISLSAEFAQLIAGQSSGTQDNASYLDDFENTKNTIDISTPSSWIISSVPSRMYNDANDHGSLKSGFHRSLLSWYYIDPLFTRRSSSLTPGHIRSDLDQLSNHFVREVYVNELFPYRDQSSYTGATSTLSILNLAYYPQERGPYNFSTDIDAKGNLRNGKDNFGGMMRKLDTNDFEQANIEYVEFWLMDPFVYSSRNGTASQYKGEFYIDLGEISEDVLPDGRKFYESGMPVDASQRDAMTATTVWGRIPTATVVNYAFATTSGSRQNQDVGFNGLSDEEERTWPDYQDFLNHVNAVVTNDSARQAILADPANDDYHYFRGGDLDARQASILERYKRINMPQGNSPENDNNPEGYDTSYKTTPDVEDINQDYTLNEYERYYRYRVDIDPDMMVVGKNNIVDSRKASVSLRNGGKDEVTWYQFRIPLSDIYEKVGNISDFSSIRFMRMFLKGFEKPIILRFGTLDLVRGEWRVYEQNLTNSASNTGKVAVSAVNIEENVDKEPVNYVLPPGIDRAQDPTQPQMVQANEQALAMTVTRLGTGESKAVYKNTTLDIRQYKRIQMFIHANALRDDNVTKPQNDQLAAFIRLGSDYKNNYYEYEIPLELTPEGNYDKYSLQGSQAVWPESNMLDIPLSVFTDIKRRRNAEKSGNNMVSFNREYSYYDDAHPKNRVTVMGNPTLGEVKTMIIGVRNLSGEAKSGEVWFNELRLKEYNNKGGWAAQGNLDMQLSDFGTVNLQGHYATDGFGGLEQGVNERQQETNSQYSVTTSLELGKFFPDKAKVSIPLYYSVTKKQNRPKYNPLDTDMELEESLDAMNSRERDSIEAIAVTKSTETNFSISNARIGIQTKRHPMPYDPANFSFSYSHSHSHTSGETTVYENEDNWRGAMNYSWTPVYKTWEPFRRLIKSKSRWWDLFKRFGLNWLPQNVAFNTEITRNYYELQERDMESAENSLVQLNYNEQFLWNRDFSLRWDFTKNLHMNFQSATHAEIEEPLTPINKDLYPDEYQAWKDSVWTSVRHFGTPLDYNQTFTMSYQMPLNLIPIFDWVNADASYNATYTWVRGTDLEDGTSLGNTITSNRTLNINGTFNLEKLYAHIPFLKKTNERFNKAIPNRNLRNRLNTVRRERMTPITAKEKNDNKKKALPKNAKSFEREVTIKADTSAIITHGKNTRRIMFSAKNEEGKSIKMKWRRIDNNRIKVFNKTDSVIRLKLTVTPKEPLENKGWYKTAQCIARVLMMVRNASVSYRNQYSLTLPGFMPTVGDAFGQTRGTGAMSPGLDFAFGLIDDSYIDKATERDWLSTNDAITTPAVSNNTEDVQMRMTLEPVRNLKIDLNVSRTQTRSRSMQYMYAGNPSTESGQLTMTTISLGTAFESLGDANNGYASSTFDKFVNSLPAYQARVRELYAGSVYPASYGGGQFNPSVGDVNLYGGDVMIPAFIDAYTYMGGNGLNIFPALKSVLPNWTIRYSGLGQLPWFRDVFKSFNINHSYKSIYAIGSYQSYSTWQEYMNGLGFVLDQETQAPMPSSRYNVSQVSVNEAFSPLLGIDATFQNNLTARLEYRQTRVLNLSMTSVQINEAISKDWVVGLGYRINNFDLFGPSNHRRVKSNRNQSKNDETNRQNASGRTQQSNRGGLNRDLNMRLDLSYRRQAALTRDIASLQSAASSGNTAFKLSFTADYTLSRLITMSLYYDLQTNTPLLSSSSYPTTTHDFGVNFKLSLTR
jgi:cell surface protein SprA